MNLADLFLTTIKHNAATHHRGILNMLIDGNHFALDRNQVNNRSDQDSINFFYHLGLRLDTAATRGTTVEGFLQYARNQVNRYPLQDFINFWYGLGLRLDTATTEGVTQGTTVAIFLQNNFDNATTATVRAAFQEAERLAQANAPIIEEEITPAGVQAVQPLQPGLITAVAAQQTMRESDVTDAFRLGTSVVGMLYKQ